MPTGNRYFQVDGKNVTIPSGNADAFLKDYPKANEVALFNIGGDKPGVIPLSQLGKFVSENPTVKPYRNDDAPYYMGLVQQGAKDQLNYINSLASVPSKVNPVQKEPENKPKTVVGEYLNDAAQGLLTSGPTFFKTVAETGKGLVNALGSVSPYGDLNADEQLKPAADYFGGWADYFSNEQAYSQSKMSDNPTANFVGGLIPSAIQMAAVVAFPEAAAPYMMSMGMQSGGSAMFQYEQKQKALGRPIDDDVKLGIGLLTAGVESATEGLGTASRYTKGLLKSVAKKNVVDAAIQNPSQVAKIFTDFVASNPTKARMLLASAKQMGKQAGEEGIEEVASTLGQATINKLFYDDEAFKGIVQNSVQSFVGGAVLGGIFSGASSKMYRNAVKKSLEQQGMAKFGMSENGKVIQIVNETGNRVYGIDEFGQPADVDRKDVKYAVGISKEDYEEFKNAAIKAGSIDPAVEQAEQRVDGVTSDDGENIISNVYPVDGKRYFVRAGVGLNPDGSVDLSKFNEVTPPIVTDENGVVVPIPFTNFDPAGWTVDKSETVLSAEIDKGHFEQNPPPQIVSFSGQSFIVTGASPQGMSILPAVTDGNSWMAAPDAEQLMITPDKYEQFDQFQDGKWISEQPAEQANTEPTAEQPVGENVGESVGEPTELIAPEQPAPEQPGSIPLSVTTGKQTFSYSAQPTESGYRVVDPAKPFNNVKSANAAIRLLKDKYPNLEFTAIDETDKSDPFAEGLWSVKATVKGSQQTTPQENPQETIPSVKATEPLETTVQPEPEPIAPVVEPVQPEPVNEPQPTDETQTETPQREAEAQVLTQSEPPQQPVSVSSQLEQESPYRIGDKVTYQGKEGTIVVTAVDPVKKERFYDVKVGEDTIEDIPEVDINNPSISPVEQAQTATEQPAPGKSPVTGGEGVVRTEPVFTETEQAEKLNTKPRFAGEVLSQSAEEKDNTLEVDTHNQPAATPEKEGTPQVDKPKFVGDFLNEEDRKRKLQAMVGKDGVLKTRASRTSMPFLSKEAKVIAMEEPNNAYEAILQFFISGKRIKTQDLKDLTGFGVDKTLRSRGKGKTKSLEEYRKLIWAHSKDGYDVDTLHMYIEFPNNDKVDAMEIENIVQDILMSVNGRNDVIDLWNKTRSVEPEQGEEFVDPYEKMYQEWEQANQPYSEEETKLINEVVDEVFLRTFESGELNPNELDWLFSLTPEQYDEYERRGQSQAANQEEDAESSEEEGNDTPGTGKGSQGKTLSTSEQQELTAVDKSIADLQASIKSLKEAKGKKLAEINSRVGLFGDTKQQSASLFDEGFEPTGENVQAAVKPFDDKIATAEREVAKLQKVQQGIIDNAGNQLEIDSQQVAEPAINNMEEKPKQEEKPKPRFAGEFLAARKEDDFSFSETDISYKEAENAYRAISFDPEKRAAQEVSDYMSDMQEMKDKLLSFAKSDKQKQIAAQEFQKYKEGYISHWKALMSAKSRTMSSMITGPARFPTGRNQKALESEHKRSVEFTEWNDKATKRAVSNIKDAATPEEKADEVWKKIKANIIGSASTIISIDKGINTYTSRPLIVNSLTGFVQRLFKNGQYDHVIRSLDLIQELNGKYDKPIVTNKNSIWSLREKSQEELSKEPAPEEPTDTTPETIYEADGIEVVNNKEIERVQIITPLKPDQSVIAELKSSGWNWSPSNKAWQRKNTIDAIRSATRLANKYFPKPLEESANRLESPVEAYQKSDNQEESPIFDPPAEYKQQTNEYNKGSKPGRDILSFGFENTRNNDGRKVSGVSTTDKIGSETKSGNREDGGVRGAGINTAVTDEYNSSRSGRSLPGRDYISYPNERREIRGLRGADQNRNKSLGGNTKTAPGTDGELLDPEYKQQEIDFAYGSEEQMRQAVEKTVQEAVDPGRGTTGVPAQFRSIPADFKESGYVDIIGREVGSSKDIAEIVALHRSPYIEKAHAFFLKNGQIIGSTAVTCNHVQKTEFISSEDAIDLAKKFGADEVWYAHNHPSGDPRTSLQDVYLTLVHQLAFEEAGIKLGGHVVIDHGKYSLIENVEGLMDDVPYVKMLAAEYKAQTYDYDTNNAPLFSRRESLIKNGKGDATRVAEIATAIMTKGDYVGGVFYLSPKLDIAAWDMFPKGSTPEQITSDIDENIKANLGYSYIIVHDGTMEFKGELPAGGLDVVNTNYGISDEATFKADPEHPPMKTMWVRFTDVEGDDNVLMEPIIGEVGANDQARNNLVVANKMEEAAGIKPEDWNKKVDSFKSSENNMLRYKIWKATGWERGADGKWRHDVDDKNFSITDPLNFIGKDVKLKDIVNDDELFAMYPQLETTKVEIYEQGKYSPHAYIDPRDGILHIGVVTPNSKLWSRLRYDAKDGQNIQLDSLKRTILHEVQHLIQGIEGFAPGGNRETAWYQANADVRAELEEKDWFKGISEEEKQRRVVDEIARRYGVDESDYGKSVLYYNISGEVEARNAIKRNELPSEQRKQIPIVDTEDTEREKQIIVKNPDDPNILKSPTFAGEYLKNLGGKRSKGNHGGYTNKIKYIATSKDMRENLFKDPIKFAKDFPDYFHELVRNPLLSVRKMENSLKTDVHSRPTEALVKVNAQANEYIRQYNEKEVTGIIDSVANIYKKAGVYQDEVGDYIYAKSALERNDNEGISAFSENENDEWNRKVVQKIVDDFEAKVPHNLINDLWDSIKKATDYTADTYYRTGRIDGETLKAYKNRFFYVPLKGWDNNPEDFYDYKSSKFVNGSKIHRAKGRTSKPDGSPIEHIVQDAYNALKTGQRNLAYQSLLRLARLNPNKPDVLSLQQTWQVRTPEGWKFVNEKPEQSLFEQTSAARKEISGLKLTRLSYHKAWVKAVREGNSANEISVQEKIDAIDDKIQQAYEKIVVKTNFDNSNYDFRTDAQAREHEVRVSENGVTYIVHTNDPNVATSIRGENIFRVGDGFAGNVWNKASNLSRAWQQNVTAKALNFFIPNHIRDMQAAEMRHAITERGNVKLFTKSYPVAAKAVNRFIRGTAKPQYSPYGDPKSPLYNPKMLSPKQQEQYWDWFTQHMFEGGMRSGYIHMKNLEQTRKELQKLIKEASKGKNPLEFVQYYLWHKPGRLLEWGGTMSEDVARLATSMTTHLQGYSDEEAVMDGKESTTNFDRGSRIKHFVAPLLPFFQARVEGAANHLHQWKVNPKRAATSAALWTTAGALLAEALKSLMDDEERKQYDNLANYVKYGYYVIPKSIFGLDSGLWRIPLPHGWAAYFAIGRIIDDLASGAIDPGQAVNNVIGASYNAFAPISVDGNDFGRSFVPPLYVPIYDNAANRDFANRTIYREPFTKREAEITPNANLGLKNTAKPLVNAARFLNDLGGGDWKAGISPQYSIDENGKVTKKTGLKLVMADLMDWNPAKVEHAFVYWAGGRGELYTQTYKLVDAIASGEEVKPNYIPVASRFTLSSNNNPTAQFWNIKKQLDLQRNAEMSAKKNNSDIFDDADHSVLNEYKLVEKKRKRYQSIIDDAESTPAEVADAKKNRDELIMEFLKNYNK